MKDRNLVAELKATAKLRGESEISLMTKPIKEPKRKIIIEGVTPLKLKVEKAEIVVHTSEGSEVTKLKRKHKIRRTQKMNHARYTRTEYNGDDVKRMGFRTVYDSQRAKEAMGSGE